MGYILPAAPAETDLNDDVIHIDETIREQGPDCVLKSTNVDSGATPTTTIRKGNCIVKKTSDGLFYLDDGPANAASADRCTQASVTAAQTADGTWASKTITVSVCGADIVTVTLGGADDTDTEVAAALNGNAIFAANCVASVAASRVVVKTLRAGANVYLKVKSNLAAAFGANGTTGHGADAEYYITEQEVSTLVNGTASDRPVRTSAKAYYKETALHGLSDEARAVISRRGARFG